MDALKDIRLEYSSKSKLIDIIVLPYLFTIGPSTVWIYTQKTLITISGSISICQRDTFRASSVNYEYVYTIIQTLINSIRDEQLYIYGDKSLDNTHTAAWERLDKLLLFFV